MDRIRIFDKEFGERSPIASKMVSNEEQMYFTMAMDMLSVIIDHNCQGKKTVMIVPVGPTGQYAYLAEMVNRLRVDLTNTYFINMDEYLDEEDQWIAKENPLSFHGQMDEYFYNRIHDDINIPKSNRIFPDPNNLENIGEMIDMLGGVDACFGGIGINGHVAFNEPPTNAISVEEFVDYTTRIVSINTETLVVNSIMCMDGYYAGMPKKAITIGMKEIFSSKKIRLYVMRDWHKAILREVLYGSVTPCVPASLLQNHKDCMICYTKKVGE